MSATVVTSAPWLAGKPPPSGTTVWMASCSARALFSAVTYLPGLSVLGGTLGGWLHPGRRLRVGDRVNPECHRDGDRHRDPRVRGVVLRRVLERHPDYGGDGLGVGSEVDLHSGLLQSVFCQEGHESRNVFLDRPGYALDGRG